MVFLIKLYKKTLKLGCGSEIFCTFVKFWRQMANELQQTLARIINKSNILVEKYHALERFNAELMSEKEQLVEEIEQLKRAHELLQQENEYLKMARVVAPDLKDVDNARATISTLVRDIDKCIAQLNQ